MKLFIERKEGDKIYHLLGKTIKTISTGYEYRITLCGIKIPNFAWFHDYPSLSDIVKLNKSSDIRLCKKCACIYKKNDISSKYTFE